MAHGIARRQMLRRAFACGCLAALAPAAPRSAAWAADTPKTTMSADEVLGMLRKGNDDFVNDRPATALLNRTRREQLASGQAPHAVLVGCSDSRVSPELLFGRGLGELFIVRVAGNSVDRTALGSIEYGVAVLGCPLVLVLGHEGCGAVKAAIDVVKDDVRFPGAIAEMVAPIIPAVLGAQRMQGDLMVNAVKENARRVARRLTDPDGVLTEPLRQGKVKVVPAYYSLADGSVEVLG